MDVTIIKLCLDDANQFIDMMKKSIILPKHWVSAPTNLDSFKNYLEKMNQPNAKSFLDFVDEIHIAGVFNISEMILGCF